MQQHKDKKLDFFLKKVEHAELYKWPRTKNA